MSAVDDEQKMVLISEQIPELQALVRGALMAGEQIINNHPGTGLGLEFLALMSILSAADKKFADLSAELSRCV